MWHTRNPTRRMVMSMVSRTRVLYTATLSPGAPRGGGSARKPGVTRYAGPRFDFAFGPPRSPRVRVSGVDRHLPRDDVLLAPEVHDHLHVRVRGRVARVLAPPVRRRHGVRIGVGVLLELRLAVRDRLLHHAEVAEVRVGVELRADAVALGVKMSRCTAQLSMVFSECLRKGARGGNVGGCPMARVEKKTLSRAGTGRATHLYRRCTRVAFERADMVAR